MNRLSIRQAVREVLGDNTENIWTNDWIHNKIDEGIVDLCRRGKIYEQTEEITYVDSTEGYDLPSDFWAVKSVQMDYGDIGNEYDIKSLVWIENKENLGKYPTYGLTKPVYYFTGLNASGTEQIFFYPVVQDAPYKPTITVRYYAVDTGLTGDGDAPEFNAVYHPLIVDYVLCWAFLLDNQITNYTLRVQSYEQKVRELNPDAGASPFMQGSPLQTGGNQ